MTLRGPLMDHILENGGSKLVVHHNHPSSSSFSDADLSLAARYRFGEFFAHGHDGSTYSMTVLKTAGMKSAYKAADDAARAVAKRIPKADRLLQEMATVHQNHLTNLVLAK